MTGPDRSLPWDLELCWGLGRVLGQVGPVPGFLVVVVGLAVLADHLGCRWEWVVLPVSICTFQIAFVEKWNQERRGR